MTILIGSNNTTGFTTVSRMAGLAGRANFQRYTCGTSGTVTSLAYYWGDTSVGSENLKMFLCNTSGLVLASTAVIATPSSVTQFVSSSVSSTAVTSGTQYYIGLYSDPNNGGADGRIGAASNGSGSYEDTTSGTYAAPPSTFSAIAANGGLPNWLGYADGTAGSNSSITPNAGSDSLTGNAPTVTSANNTIVMPITAERRILIPRERKIFLPTRLNRAA